YDRRGAVRYALGVGTNCTINRSVFDPPGTPGGAADDSWPLVVQDVSATGVGLLLARRCEPGAELILEVPAGDGVLALAVRVVRVRKDGFGHWAHGCAFPAPLGRTELYALIHSLGRGGPG
ncbi:MAG: PilZ domain-containing protein, partial [Gemmataceae bacterium]|nr:PilZ domain-containing protein [Gemmataceae bacterium]